MCFCIVIYSNVVEGTRVSTAFFESILFASFSCSAKQMFNVDLLVEDHHRDINLF